MNKPLFINRRDSDRVPQRQPHRRIRTMLVDDSLVMRSILQRIVAAVPDIDIVGSFARATDALAFLDDATVDVIVLDIEMPGMSGMVALPDLIRKSNGARILILSSNCVEGGPAAVQALALGAADTLAKPAHGSYTDRFDAALIERITALADDPKAHPAPRAEERIGSSKAPQGEGIFARPERAPRCIAIASSTGGIGALNALLTRLGDHVAAPIVLTQHLPPAFIAFFATQLGKVTGRSVTVAETGQKLKERHIYVAPGHGHITLVPTPDGAGRIVLSSAPASSGCCPSADPMLHTLGEVFGSGGIAIVLSGMGRDGSEGARVAHAKGAAIVAQAAGSCVVWGMPGAIVKAGLAGAILDPVDAASYVNDAARVGAR